MVIATTLLVNVLVFQTLLAATTFSLVSKPDRATPLPATTSLLVSVLDPATLATTTFSLALLPD
jgi:hypothetical protein